MFELPNYKRGVIVGLFLSCNLSSYTNNRNSELLSVNVSYLESIKFLVNYFNKYPLIWYKLNDFKKWEIVYNMIIKKNILPIKED